MMNRQGRPTQAGEATQAAHDTFSGNHALAIEEPLIFEIGRTDTTGVDLDEPAAFAPRLGKLARQGPIGLPGLSEPEAFRHFGGVSRTLLGDNARALVARRDRETATVMFTPAYLQFCRDWDVEPRACAPYRARTKGKTESGVKWECPDFGVSPRVALPMETPCRSAARTRRAASRRPRTRRLTVAN